MFTIGQFTLKQRGGKWYRVWQDKRSHRVSMGTADFEVAKTRLLEWYYQNHKMAPGQPGVLLAEVLLDYWNHHANKLVSASTVKILLRYWNEFWGSAAVKDLRDINRQEAFHDFLRAKKLSPNSINRVLEIGRAAVRRAWKRGVIDFCPYVETVKARTDKPMGRPLSLDELRAYYHGSDEQHWHDFVLLALGTGGRTKAVCSLTKEQIDFSAGLINLNPEGREQTNKYRATVRLLPTLRERFKDRPNGPLIVFHGKPVGKVINLTRIARKRAGLDARVNSYSFRHTVARYLRQQGVDTAEIAALLGHRRFGFSMTLRYMPHAPDYLVKSAEALEKLLQEVLAPVEQQKLKKA